MTSSERRNGLFDDYYSETSVFFRVILRFLPGEIFSISLLHRCRYVIVLLACLPSNRIEQHGQVTFFSRLKSAGKKNKAWSLCHQGVSIDKWICEDGYNRLS